MPEIRHNRAKRKLQNGEVVTMLMGGAHPPDMIDFMGQFGFDSVLIEVEGSETTVDAFLRELPQKAPAPSRIASLDAQMIRPIREVGFHLRQSESSSRGVPLGAERSRA